ncbi:MAG: family 16 glycosylhydrolase, partial [Chthoniobacterales bacterium]
GYFECSAKIPNKNGVSLAWWMSCLDGWPPEIDIFEIPGGIGRDSSGKMTNDHVTVHYLDPAKQYSNGTRGGIYKSPVDLSADYHTFGLLWQPGLLAWYVDGVCIHVQKYGVPNRDMYVQLQFAAKDNDAGWNGNASGTPMPQYAYIRWVRIWKMIGTQGTVAVKSLANSKLVTAADAATPLIANFTGTAGAAQLFDAYDAGGGGQIALLAHTTALFVTAGNNGADSLLANGASIAATQTFQVESLNFDRVAFQSPANSLYVQAANAGATALKAAAATASTSATSLEGFIFQNQLTPVVGQAYSSPDIVRISVTGKKTLKTKKGVVTVRGKATAASGGISKVTYQLNGKGAKKKAKGTLSWKTKIKVPKKGVTKWMFTSYDLSGIPSAPLTIKIIRQ